MIRLANISNGLAYDHDDVCNFQSQYGHHCNLGYFRMDSMPYRAVIHILKGGMLEVIDATAKAKALTDALKFGVPTWCIVLNRAMRFDYENIKVCSWQTSAMIHAARQHKSYVHMLRKLIRLYGKTDVPITIDNQVHLVCHSNFEFDDNMESYIQKQEKKYEISYES